MTLSPARVVALVAIVVVAAPLGAVRGAQRGVIKGTVLDGATEEPQRGVKVTLSIGSPRDEQVERRSVIAKADGTFVFDDLATGERHIYALDASFDGGVFAGGALTIPSDTTRPPVIDTTLRVWKTTDDPASILVRRDDLFVLEPKGSSASVIETITIINTSDEAYIGRAARGGVRPTLGFALPSETSGGVSILRADLDIPDIIETSFGFAATIAIPPGEHKITFAYAVEGRGGTFDLSRPALYPVLDASVFASPELRVTSNRLEEAGEETVDGDRYVRYAAGGRMDAGDSIQVVATADAPVAGALTAGAVLLVGLSALIGGVAFARQRRGRRRAVAAAPKPPEIPGTEGRDELIVEIARLDKQYRAGEIDEETWHEKRHELKRRVEYAGRK